MMTNSNRSAQKRNIYLGAFLLALSMVCVAMTIIFVYVSDKSDRRVEEIRQEYRAAANRRDKKVEVLSVRVASLQQKISALPDQTASKTAEKVQQVVSEDEDK